jgi:16S rRNA processing protein RimM
MGRLDPDFLVVGHINKPHGTKGELLVWLLTDHPEGVYAPGVVLRMGDGDSDRPDPDLPPLRVDEARPFRKGYLVRFGGVDSRSQADLLRGRYLFRETDEIEPLGEGEVFYHQLLGMEVFTKSGARVGEITEIYEMSPADLLEVRTDSGEIMIPFLEHIVVEVDVDGARLVVDPPAGLLEL